MRKWQTLKSEYIYRTPFGNLRKDCCQLPSGFIIDEYYVNEYADWVNAVVLTKEHEIVLVRQYRHPGQDFYLEIPAGKVEENESYEEGILREVREETGYISDSKPILLGEFMVNPATQTNKVISFLIPDAYKAYEQALDEDEHEHVTLEVYHLAKFEKMLREKKITQHFSVSAYYMAKAYLNNQHHLL